VYWEAYDDYVDGTITHINKDGTYSVNFDDDDYNLDGDNYTPSKMTMLPPPNCPVLLRITLTPRSESTEEVPILNIIVKSWMNGEDHNAWDAPVQFKSSDSLLSRPILNYYITSDDSGIITLKTFGLFQNVDYIFKKLLPLQEGKVIIEKGSGGLEESAGYSLKIHLSILKPADFEQYDNYYKVDFKEKMFGGVGPPINEEYIMGASMKVCKIYSPEKFLFQIKGDGTPPSLTDPDNAQFEFKEIKSITAPLYEYILAYLKTLEQPTSQGTPIFTQKDIKDLLNWRKEENLFRNSFFNDKDFFGNNVYHYAFMNGSAKNVKLLDSYMISIRIAIS